MPTYRVSQVRIGRIFNPRAAMVSVRGTLQKQWRERFATSGASDGPGKEWRPLAHRQGQPLVSTGKLRDTVAFATDLRPGGFSVTYGSGLANALVANVHQFGTFPGRDIVPVRKKALFIPLTRRAGRSKLAGGFRFGQTAGRRGRRARTVSLKKGKDFLLVKRIKATADKGYQAIPQRQFARVTPMNLDEIIENIRESQTGR